MVNASVFQALADPTRLCLVEALREGERSVSDLVAAVDIHQSGVSRHLRILHELKLVKVRPRGPQRLYSLRPEHFQQLEEWVSRYRTLWDGRLDRFSAELKRRQRARAPKRKEPTR